MASCNIRLSFIVFRHLYGSIITCLLCFGLFSQLESLYTELCQQKFRLYTKTTKLISELSCMYIFPHKKKNIIFTINVAIFVSTLRNCIHSIHLHIFPSRRPHRSIAIDWRGKGGLLWLSQVSALPGTKQYCHNHGQTKITNAGITDLSSIC